MDEELWKGCVGFHGHACPGLAIGYRAAEAACGILGLEMERAGDEDIVCVAETDMCGLDSIQWLLSCTVGKGNMVLRPRGKTAFSFFDRRTGRAVRLVLRPFDRSGTKEETIQMILNMPCGELFKVGEPSFGIPERARIFDSVVCSVCGEPVREDMVRLHGGRHVCLDCFRPYDRGWL